jgi:endonuclease/exonuclease/phosphatase family metal-dependent hydrolase
MQATSAPLQTKIEMSREIATLKATIAQLSADTKQAVDEPKIVLKESTPKRCGMTFEEFLEFVRRQIYMLVETYEKKIICANAEVNGVLQLHQIHFDNTVQALRKKDFNSELNNPAEEETDRVKRLFLDLRNFVKNEVSQYNKAAFRVLTQEMDTIQIKMKSAENKKELANAMKKANSILQNKAIHKVQQQWESDKEVLLKERHDMIWGQTVTSTLQSSPWEAIVAESDHQPVSAEIGNDISVASHNVLEEVPSAVEVYATSLGFESTDRLYSKYNKMAFDVFRFLFDQAPMKEAHVEATVEYVRNQLEKVQFVCLQEVTPRTLHALQLAFVGQVISAPAQTRVTKDGAQILPDVAGCYGMCAIVVHASVQPSVWPMVTMPFVANGKSRQAAACRYEKDGDCVIIFSLHVPHASKVDNNTQTATAAVQQLFKHARETDIGCSGKVTIVVCADFNAHVVLVLQRLARNCKDEWVVDATIPNEASIVTKNGENGPTVDGIIRLTQKSSHVGAPPRKKQKGSEKC